MPIDPSKVQWDAPIDTSKVNWDTPKQPRAIVRPKIEEPSFEAKHPILNAAIKTFEGVPRVISHGMTLGLSEKVRDLGRQAAEYVTGSKIQETEPYESIPQASRSVGEFVGAAAPIGKAFAVAKPATIKVFQKVMQGSRYAEPIAKVATGSGLGAAYTTAEKGINEGELPTAGELGKSAAMWGGMEGLGLGLEYGLGIRNLAKTWGMPMRDTAAIIRQEAKTQNMPTIEYLQTKNATQNALKRAIADKAIQETVPGAIKKPTPFKERVDALVNHIPPEDKRGTYADLTEQVAGEVEKPNTSPFPKMGYEEPPKPIEIDRPVYDYLNPEADAATRGALSLEIERIQNTPPFLRTAEDKIALDKFMQGGKAVNLPKPELPQEVGNMEDTKGIIKPVSEIGGSSARKPVELEPIQKGEPINEANQETLLEKPLARVEETGKISPTPEIVEPETKLSVKSETQTIAEVPKVDTVPSPEKPVLTNIERAKEPDIETTIQNEQQAIKSDNPEISVEESGNKAVLKSTTQKENVQPKEQKKFLLSAIDEALQKAGEGPNIPRSNGIDRRFNADNPKKVENPKTYRQKFDEHVQGLKDQYGTVTIDIPGDGTFTVINTKQALTSLKKKAQFFPVETTRADKILQGGSPKPTGKRISSEDVSYYNEFKPRKQSLITRSPEDVNKYGATQLYDSKNGWFSDGIYGVKTERPSGITLQKGREDINFTKVIPKHENEAKIIGEFSDGVGEKPQTFVHIISTSGNDIIVEAKYIDAILTKHPNAKVYAGESNHPIVFKDKGGPVGVVMPVKQSETIDVRETFPDRIAEIVKEPAMASTDKAATTLRSSMGAIAGIEQDEEGNYRYDLGKGLVGMAGGVALGRGFDKFKRGGLTGSKPTVDISKLTPDQISVREKLVNGAASAGKNLEQFMKNAGAKPEFIQEVKAYQNATKQQRLSSTIQGKAPLIPLPKYARSINLERQNIPDNLKQTEAQIAAGLPPKKVQTWEQTQQLADEITNDYRKGAQLFNKMKYHGTVNAQEALAARQVAVNSVDELKRIVNEGTPEEIAARFNEYQNNIFKPLSEATSEAGRTLNIFRKEVSVNRLIKDFSKLKREMNERELEEFKKLNLEDPIAVKSFADRLGDPKLMDYVYEYWYNSILSGVPTHAVNVASNTLWSMWQLPHRALVGGVDSIISKFTGRQREVFSSEVIPMLAGMKTGFRKGMEGAKEVIKTGRLDGYETKWSRELGGAVVGAFERSPYKLLRKVAPVLSFPTRALRAMDVAANSMAYDAQLQAIAYRTGKQKGFSGGELNDFVYDYLANPQNIPQSAMKEAADFASYSTFMDDPGWISQAALRLRNMGADFESIGTVQPLRFFIPFVTTIGNLMKRGLEMTPGVGLALTRGQKPAEVIAKQLEGAIIAGAVMHKVSKGEITGSAPEEKNEREAFYREGKLPWAIKIGDSWYQYRRIEPFNTVVAAAANAYSQIQNAKSGKEAEDIMMDVAKNFSDNLLDSSYFQGITNLLDKYGNRKGMFQRQAASFTPFSGFFRSINRATESTLEGDAKIRDTSTLKGAFSQVVPFMYGSQPVKLDVWGNEKKLQGGAIRQFSPYKMSAESNDPVEKELARLKYYPGLPSDKVKIGNLNLDIPQDLYRTYLTRTGQETKEYFKEAIKHPEYRSWTDQEKRDHLESEFKATRDDYRDEVKAISFAEAFKKASPEEKKRLETELDNSKASDELRGMIEDLILGPKQ